MSSSAVPCPARAAGLACASTQAVTHDPSKSAYQACLRAAQNGGGRKNYGDALDEAQTSRDPAKSVPRSSNKDKRMTAAQAREMADDFMEECFPEALWESVAEDARGQGADRVAWTISRNGLNTENIDKARAYDEPMNEDDPWSEENSDSARLSRALGAKQEDIYDSIDICEKTGIVQHYLLPDQKPPRGSFAVWETGLDE